MLFKLHKKFDCAGVIVNILSVRKPSSAIQPVAKFIAKMLEPTFLLTFQREPVPPTFFTVPTIVR